MILGETGPMPLIVSTLASVRLEGDEGKIFDLEEVEPPEGLQGARGAWVGELRYFRPKEPLADGKYWATDTQGVAFTVNSVFASQLLPDAFEAELSWYIGSDGIIDELAGCGDPTRLTITIKSPKTTITSFGEPQVHMLNYIVHFSSDDGLELSRFIRSDSNGRGGDLELSFDDSFPVSGVPTQKICIKVAGVTRNGEVGPENDLGCINPDNTSDSRITDNSGVGCSTSSNTKSIPVMMIFALVFGATRLSRRKVTLDLCR